MARRERPKADGLEKLMDVMLKMPDTFKQCYTNKDHFRFDFTSLSLEFASPYTLTDIAAYPHKFEYDALGYAMLSGEFERERKQALHNAEDNSSHDWNEFSIVALGLELVAIEWDWVFGGEWAYKDVTESTPDTPEMCALRIQYMLNHNMELPEYFNGAPDSFYMPWEGW